MKCVTNCKYEPPKLLSRQSILGYFGVQKNLINRIEIHADNHITNQKSTNIWSKYQLSPRLDISWFNCTFHFETGPFHFLQTQLYKHVPPPKQKNWIDYGNCLVSPLITVWDENGKGTKYMSQNLHFLRLTRVILLFSPVAPPLPFQS